MGEHIEVAAQSELLKGVREVGEMGGFDQDVRRVPLKFER